MNRQIRKAGTFLALCYLALFVQLNVVQVATAKSLNDKPGNSRKVERDFNRPRGDIVTADGKVVAHSVEGDGRFAYQRTYPTDELFAQIIGTYSFVFGSDGVEKYYDEQLSGQSAEFQLKGLLSPFTETPNVGTVELTLRADVQSAAREALGTKVGSVVAIDPRSGALLAMWSYPSFNPNLTSTNDTMTARAFRTALAADPAKPTLPKTYRERYFPGSTFKVVTAAAGLESGVITADAPDFPVARNYTAPLTNRPLSNFGGSSCGGTLVAILRVSCNSAFAQMGAEYIGPEQMVRTAEKFGFGSAPNIDLPKPVSSVFPTDYGKRLRDGAVPGGAGIFENTPALAQASIGQGDVSATPLQMALVAATIANSGNQMTPHVMSSIRDGSGATIKEYSDSVATAAISKENAAILRAAMIEVVTDGTAKAAAIDGVDVGAKTGTAQLGTPVPSSHAWVITFAGPPGQPATVAVAVLVQAQPGASEQTGGTVAAPIANKVMQAALTPIPSSKPAGPTPGS